MEPTAKFDRRRLLKALAATGGVVAASALVPSKWSKPQVGVGALPAHAQTTGGYDLLVEACWSGSCDIDLLCYGPDIPGEPVGPDNRFGATATHHGGVESGGNGACEAVSVGAGQADGNCYHFDVEAYGECRAAVTVRVTTADGVEERVYEMTGGDDCCVVTICFPARTVEWIICEPDDPAGTQSWHR